MSKVQHEYVEFASESGRRYVLRYIELEGRRWYHATDADTAAGYRSVRLSALLGKDSPERRGYPVAHPYISQRGICEAFGRPFKGRRYQQTDEFCTWLKANYPDPEVKAFVVEKPPLRQLAIEAQELAIEALEQALVHAKDALQVLKP